MGDISDYARLPEHMRDAASDYIEDHRGPGHFLYAVLSNDLVGAFGRADEANRDAMHDWAMWLYNDIPSAAWGTPEKVDAWVAERE